MDFKKYTESSKIIFYELDEVLKKINLVLKKNTKYENSVKYLLADLVNDIINFNIKISQEGFKDEYAQALFQKSVGIFSVILSLYDIDSGEKALKTSLVNVDYIINKKVINDDGLDDTLYKLQNKITDELFNISDLIINNFIK